MTAHTLESPDELWEDWKDTVPRSYERLGDRINELIALDLLAQQNQRIGIIEQLDRDGVVDEDDVKALLDEMTEDESTQNGDTSNGGDDN